MHARSWIRSASCLSAVTVACAALAAVPAQATYYENICGDNGTYVQPKDHCPYNPNGHTWVYNEVWRSNQNDYDQPFYERVYHGDTQNGELLSSRVHYGNGYVDSANDLYGNVASWTKRAFATNDSTWANMTLWGQAHTA